jgi:hypothetical protein
MTKSIGDSIDIVKDLSIQLLGVYHVIEAAISLKAFGFLITRKPFKFSESLIYDTHLVLTPLPELVYLIFF